MKVEYENEDEDEYSDKDEEIEDDEYTDMFEEESDSEDDDFDENALFKLTTAAEQYTFNSVGKWHGRPTFSDPKSLPSSTERMGVICFMKKYVEKNDKNCSNFFFLKNF